MGEYPVTLRDADVFLHGTSIKNYLDIQSSGFLKQKVSRHNWGISKDGVCFEKWVIENDEIVMKVLTSYCHSACSKDGSTEGIILKITGKELRKLNCPIYNDPNKNDKLLYDSEGIPIGVDSNSPILSIIVKSDIPVDYLKEVKRIPYEEM